MVHGFWRELYGYGTGGGILSHTQLLSKREMRILNSGTTAYALSMHVLDMINLVKGNYGGGDLERVP